MATSDVDTTRLKRKHRDILLLFLTTAAGAMDGFSLLRMGHVFTSALSGNTVLLGISIVTGQFNQMIHSSLVFAGFIPASALGSMVLSRRQPKYEWNPVVGFLLFLEVILLLTFYAGVLVGDNTGANPIALDGLIVFTSAAMGLQNAIGRRLSGAGVTTTYVTGPIVRIIGSVSAPSPGVASVPPADDARSRRRFSARRGHTLFGSTERFLAAIWGSYLIGVAADATLGLLSPLAAAAFPVVTVVGVLGAQLVFPYAAPAGAAADPNARETATASADGVLAPAELEYGSG